MSQPKINQAEADKIIAAINPEKIIAEHKTDLAEAQMANLANERAMREPLPSDIAEALDMTPIQVKTSVGDVEIRPMKAIDITIFKITDSPLYKIIMGDIGDTPDASAFKTMFPDEEVLYGVIYQFTHPAKDVYKLVKKDKLAYKEIVIEEIGTAYTPKDMVDLVGAILAHIGMTNNVKADFEAPASENEGEKKRLST